MDWKKLGVRLGTLLIVLGLLACNKEKNQAESKCQADTDCKNGTLCEGGMCIPAEVAKKAREADKPAKKEESREAKEKEEPEEDEPPQEEWEGDVRVPKIPHERSDPPTLPDWMKAPEVNTQHEHGLAKNCSMKVIREWIRVMCRGDVLGFQDLNEFGKKQQDYYFSVKKGESFSLVARIKQGPKQTVRLCRKEDRASLVVYWPMKRSRPEHIALGDGPKCALEEYHDGTESEEDEQATEEERADEKNDADHGEGGQETEGEGEPKPEDREEPKPEDKEEPKPDESAK